MNAPSSFPDVVCPKRLVRQMCAKAFGVAEHRILGASRKADIVRVRHATCYVLKKRFPEMSYPVLGRMMGGRDHSTIINAVIQNEVRMGRDPELAQIVKALIAGRIPQQHDFHVKTWRAAHFAQARKGLPPLRAAIAVDQADIDDELAEFVDPEKVFCHQCDRSLTIPDAMRCKSQFCSLVPVRQAFAV